MKCDRHFCAETGSQFFFFHVVAGMPASVRFSRCPENNKSEVGVSASKTAYHVSETFGTPLLRRFTRTDMNCRELRPRGRLLKTSPKHSLALGLGIHLKFPRLSNQPEIAPNFPNPLDFMFGIQS